MNKRCDVVLVETSQWVLPSKPSYYKVMSQFPLGLGYLSATLTTQGIKSEIIDLNMEEIDDATLENYFLCRKPSIIGLSSMSSNYKNAKHIASVAKRTLKKVYVVYGGIHASLVNFKILLDCNDIDFVLTGEAEYSFLELSKKLLAGERIDTVHGLYFRNGSSICSGPKAVYPRNLDELPLPAYETSYTSIKRYYSNFNSKKRTMSMISSRGCPHNCPYCSTTEFHGRAYRARSIDSIMSEVDYLENKYGIEQILFVDDSFASNHSRLINVCDAIKTKHPKLIWGCSCRLNDLNEENLKKMAQTGCRKIFIGIETLSEKLQKQIKKTISLDKLKYVIDYSVKHDIHLTLAFMLGFPGETNEDRKTIIHFVDTNKNKVRDWRFSPLVVYPGTKFWKDCDKYGMDLKSANELDPVGLPRSYMPSIAWHDLLQDLVTLHRLSMESRLKNGEFYKIVAPSVKLQ